MFPNPPSGPRPLSLLLVLTFLICLPLVAEEEPTSRPHLTAPLTIEFVDRHGRPWEQRDSAVTFSIHRDPAPDRMMPIPEGGWLHLTDVSPGDYQCTQYPMAEVQLLKPCRFTVQADQPAKVRVTLIGCRDASIVGTVVDHEGNPVAGANVTVHGRLDINEPSSGAVADDQGRYVIDKVDRRARWERLEVLVPGREDEIAFPFAVDGRDLVPDGHRMDLTLPPPPPVGLAALSAWQLVAVVVAMVAACLLVGFRLGRLGRRS